MDKHSETKSKEDLGYLFNVEILIRNETNAKALQSLLQVLNQGEDIIDYKINSGIELGEIIESLLTEKKKSIISKSYKRLTNAESEKKAPEPKKTTSPFEQFAGSEEFQQWIKRHIADNRLVRLLVNRNGERISIPCRILNFLAETSTINVYHVDEKQVYTFNLNEIIEFSEK
ncbi:hypothetical protein J25TS5_33150 [Paenibacillus faecis]|uniref:YolD-like family protein n=1 Tax=Paenibacillus faecis TaxID=862114 RepID=A0A5D0CZ65_9BACL|nr:MULTISPECIES: hypothetical protein [Paenibacillus]MCA1291770.1 hypothetical protein [Paenibacillus sp. alder61]TYA14988.1 hypothetical protein FRY98_04810 [Paenibacillus faecis]GIO86383.1 hypothetical protein J25TS5_33150 [Paenibacillus faecis]